MRQCELLDLCRSSLYYQPKPISEADRALMRRIDELHLAHPFLGARRLARMLQREGITVGRRHVGTLMQLMGIEAIYRKQRTSIPDKGHRISPYLLAPVAIERPDQAWAADITSLPMATGCAYLVAILDLYSRTVLSVRVSTAMTTDFCIEAVEEALTSYGAPEIFNTDQGSQVTADDFTRPLHAKGVRVSMDGHGALGRQCVRRAAVAQRQVRGPLAARLRDDAGVESSACELFRFLQCTPAAPEPRLSHAGRDVFWNRRNERSGVA